MLAALEIFNKPAFEYRVESFAILAVNAWELLLKARLVSLSGNSLKVLYVREPRTNKSGDRSKKLYIKRNRANVPMTIGLFRCFDLLRNDYAETLPNSVRANLDGLVQVRDSSVHLMKNDDDLTRAIHSFGAACVHNYASMFRQWFGDSVDGYNFSLMPIGFSSPPITSAVQLSKAEVDVLKYLQSRPRAAGAGPNGESLATALEMDVILRPRDGSKGGAAVRLTSDPSAPAVHLSDSEVLKRYPHTYDALTKKLAKRYSDFKQNDRYHAIRRSFEADPQYCLERKLDPSNPKSGKKRFYSGSIIDAFDKHYARKQGRIRQKAKGKR